MISRQSYLHISKYLFWELGIDDYRASIHQPSVIVRSVVEIHDHQGFSIFQFSLSIERISSLDEIEGIQYSIPIRRGDSIGILCFFRVSNNRGKSSIPKIDCRVCRVDNHRPLHVQPSLVT